MTFSLEVLPILQLGKSKRVHVLHIPSQHLPSQWLPQARLHTHLQSTVLSDGKKQPLPHGQDIPFHPPAGIWPLVSLLLHLIAAEGDMIESSWNQRDLTRLLDASDTLAAETLQV